MVKPWCTDISYQSWRKGTSQNNEKKACTDIAVIELWKELVSNGGVASRGGGEGGYCAIPVKYSTELGAKYSFGSVTG